MPYECLGYLYLHLPSDREIFIAELYYYDNIYTDERGRRFIDNCLDNILPHANDIDKVVSLLSKYTEADSICERYC